MDTYSDAVFLIQQTTKQHQKCDDVWNHMTDHPNMVNQTISGQKRGIFSAIYNFLFGPNESQDVNLKRMLPF